MIFLNVIKIIYINNNKALIILIDIFNFLKFINREFSMSINGMKLKNEFLTYRILPKFELQCTFIFF